jgi:hypothetical protein
VNIDEVFDLGRFHVNVYNTTGDTALFRLIGDGAGNGNYAQFGSDGVFRGMIVGGLDEPDAMLDVRGYMCIEDGSTAPTNIANRAFIYVDTADGDLKVMFADGFTAVLAADS